ncbi:MAG: L-threonylcarbamoyladenylate synthase [Planctomycetota bacterium]|nr:L-threonylcarbamoyladenylate synthase [Planctomycetota bacterium]
MKTEILKIDPKAYQLPDLERPGAILKEGGLVAFPTETVYGIACDAHNPDAVSRLCKVKRRPKEKPLSLHVANRDDINRYVTSVPHMAEIMMDRFWPGPLTIIFPGNADKGVGIRFPANRLAQDLIRLAKVPIAMPSANFWGEDAPGEAGKVIQDFEGKIEMIIDGGPCELREPSTVVRVDDRSWEVLREGIISQEMIKNLVCKTILFVCTGNSCRSPMAEGLLKKAVAERLGLEPNEIINLGYRILSAGTSAFQGSRASQPAIKVMKEMDVDISSHAAQPITLDLMEEADFVYVMGHNHALILKEWMPEIARKVRMMHPDGIDDPIGMPIEHYRSCAAKIDEQIAQVLDQLELPKIPEAPEEKDG